MILLFRFDKYLLQKNYNFYFEPIPLLIGIVKI